MIDLKPVLQTAIRAIEAAIPLTTRMQAAGCEAAKKSDNTPVTAADLAAQVVITHTLARTTPAFGMISEESSQTLMDPAHADIRDTVLSEVKHTIGDTSIDRAAELLDFGSSDADYTWVLDPIDGTRGFIRGQQYTLALALLHQGEIVLGVMGCPNHRLLTDTGALFFASKGQKAWSMTSSGAISMLHVNETTEPSDTYLVRGVSSDADVDKLQPILDSCGSTRTPLQIDGMGKYATVASGETSAYIRIPGSSRKESIWDHAAGAFILSEAGGKVTDINGSALDFSQGLTLSKNHGILASNSHLHPHLLDLIQQLD